MEGADYLTLAVRKVNFDDLRVGKFGHAHGAVNALPAHLLGVDVKHVSIVLMLGLQTLHSRAQMGHQGLARLKAMDGASLPSAGRPNGESPAISADVDDCGGSVL